MTRSAEMVIRNELLHGKTDIIHFCQSNYGILKSIVPDDAFFDSIEGLALQTRADRVEQEFGRICRKRADFIAHEILQFVVGELGNTSLHAVWLFTIGGLLERYGKMAPERIGSYSLQSGQFRVIADLGEGGALFVF